MYTKTTVALKPKFKSSLFLCAVFIFFITSKLLNLHNNDPKIFSLHIFGLNTFLISVGHVKAVQDDISQKTVPN